MILGLTYDLKDDYLAEGYTSEEVAECDSHVTIDALEAELQSLGYETVRIGNIKALVRYLAAGNRCDLVFNIAEGLYGLCRESQIPALLDAYRIPYVFSDSFTLAACLQKAVAKALVREQGVNTADYVLVRNEQDLDTVSLAFPLFLKPVGGGTGMGITENSIVHTKEELYKTAKALLNIFSEGVLVETYLTGREFTVGITGTGDDARSVGVMEIVVDNSCDKGIYSYKTKQEYLDFAAYKKPSEADTRACEAVALGAWKALQCRDGGRIDVKMDGQGRVNFLEVNPLAGLHPIDSDLPILSRMHGVSYHELIERIMASAQKRLACVS